MKYKEIITLCIILFTHMIAFVLIKDHGLMVDENYHYEQIVKFTNGVFTPNPKLAMPPGYHLAIVYTAKAMGVYPYFQIARAISFTFSLLTIFMFYAIARRIDKHEALLKTLQYSFFPLTFMFFPLLYTDLFSVLLLFVALFLVFDRFYFLSSIVATVSILVRQNNLIWMVFLNTLIYVKEYGWVFTGSIIQKHIQKTAVFLLGPIVFGIYLLINKGLSYGSQTSPFFTFKQPSNIFMILLLFPFFFFPVTFALREEIWYFVKKHRALLLFFLPALFVIYQALFTNSHPYNTATFFLHNALTVVATASILSKLVVFAVMVVAVLTIIKVKLHHKAYLLLYPFTILFLLPQWIIEQRYYIVPFILFLLFRKLHKPVVEYSILIGFILISLYIYYGIFNWNFFI